MEAASGSAPIVAVNALTATFGGGKTVIANVVGRLAELRPDWHFEVLVADREAVDFEDAKRPNLECHELPALASAPRRWIFEQLRLPARLRQLGADVMLNFGGFACFASPVPQISVWQNPNITSREAVARSWRTQSYIALQRAAQAASVNRAAHHIFPTRDAEAMALDRWPMDERRHSAIHWGADSLARSSADAPPLDGREPFALAVGHSYFHKNYEALIDAMVRLPAHLAAGDEGLRLEIVGGPYDPAHYRALQDRARWAGLGDRVHFHGALPGAAVRDLYQRARVYVTTSLLETFGLTTLEAMANGLPVVASRASCLPEVCGEAAHYCDPRDPGDIARALAEVGRASETAAELRGELRARGFERVRSFRWDDTAAGFAAVLDRVLREAGVDPS